MTDEIELPQPPDLIDNDNLDYGEIEEITNHNELKDISPLALNLNFAVETIKESDFDYLNLHDLEKTLLKDELVSSNMYLKNIHKGFKFARSTRSLIALVGAGLAVHKHRRQVIKDLKENKGSPFEIDEHGNVKS